MDSELKQHLEAMDARFIALSRQMQEMESRLNGNMQEMESRLRTHTADEFERLETKLLGEFWKWGRTADMRTKQALDNVSAFGERLLAVEDRITALERNRPNAPSC